MFRPGFRFESRPRYAETSHRSPSVQDRKDQTQDDRQHDTPDDRYGPSEEELQDREHQDEDGKVCEPSSQYATSRYIDRATSISRPCTVSAQITNTPAVIIRMDHSGYHGSHEKLIRMLTMAMITPTMRAHT